MSRRSSRRAPKKAALNLPDNVLRGLSSLVEGNEDLIAKMLSTKKEDDAPLVTALTDCMAMNNLSAEALLARFFDSSVLSVYCIKRIGASGKGNEATLAARIARAWGESNFEALPIDDDEKEKKASSPLNEKEEASPSKKHTKEDKNTEDEKDTPKKKKQKK